MRRVLFTKFLVHILNWFRKAWWRKRYNFFFLGLLFIWAKISFFTFCILPPWLIEDTVWRNKKKWFELFVLWELFVLQYCKIFNTEFNLSFFTKYGLLESDSSKAMIYFEETDFLGDPITAKANKIRMGSQGNISTT